MVVAVTAVSGGASSTSRHARPGCDNSTAKKTAVGDHRTGWTPAAWPPWRPGSPVKRDISDQVPTRRCYPGITYPSDTNEVAPNVYLTASYTSAGVVEEFNQSGQLLWRYAPAGAAALNKPSPALPLPNGDVPVNDDWNHPGIVIDPRLNGIVWQYGVRAWRVSPPDTSTNPTAWAWLPVLAADDQRERYGCPLFRHQLSTAAMLLGYHHACRQPSSYDLLMGDERTRPALMVIGVWSLNGPLSPGWASGAGSSSRLLTANRAAPSVGSTATASAPGTGASHGIPARPFDTVLTGSVTQGSPESSGQVTVTLTPVVSETMQGSLVVVLHGQASGNGVSPAAGSVSFGAVTATTKFKVQVDLLNADQLAVHNGAGASIEMALSLQVDPSTGSFQGQMHAVAAPGVDRPLRGGGADHR